uniref:YciI family protein n=1 Tax=Klebsiella pneumoniae TaxID=573 RepID=UPI0039E2A797
MKYMMFVVTAAEPDTESDESDVDLWVDELDASGKRVIGEVLQPPSEARVVRVRDGKRYVTDGPFAETKEWICGFDI